MSDEIKCNVTAVHYTGPEPPKIYSDSVSVVLSPLLSPLSLFIARIRRWILSIFIIFSYFFFYLSATEFILAKSNIKSMDQITKIHQYSYNISINVLQYFVNVFNVSNE